jgi:virginiamycin B lyase
LCGSLLSSRITTSGDVTDEFSLPEPANGPIVASPDGNLWFTEVGLDDATVPADNPLDNIVRMTPAGVVTEFALPTPGGGPFGLAIGPDGNLWFTESAGNKIGRFTL